MVIIECVWWFMWVDFVLELILLFVLRVVLWVYDGWMYGVCFYFLLKLWLLNVNFVYKFIKFVVF